jgi:hypothetical protein
LKRVEPDHEKKGAVRGWQHANRVKLTGRRELGGTPCHRQLTVKSL